MPTKGIAALVALTACSVPADHEPPPIELALWSAPATTTETTRRGDERVAGKPWTEVHDVSRPTITFYPLRAENRCARRDLPAGRPRVRTVPHGERVTHGPELVERKAQHVTR
jgi:hypothetical protein